MPTLHSHGNTNVSKIWFVVLFAFAAMVVVAWKLYEGLREITYHSEAISSQIDDLLKDPR